MSRAGLIVAIGALLLVGVLSYAAPTPAGADGPVENTIRATVDVPGSSTPGSPGGTRVIPCRWFDGAATDDQADALNRITQIIVELINTVTAIELVVTITYYSDGGVLHRWSERRARFEKFQIADCSRATHPGGVSDGDGRWVVSVPPDPAILVPDASDAATEPIQLPAPDVNPSTGSAVNLGLWLAVEPPPPITARAEIGPVWAETTARLETTTFDPGDGAPPIVCEGHGTPLPDSELDTIEQGPCGYTYPESSAGSTFDLTITSTWSVTWVLSDGRTGSDPPIVVTTIVPYEVFEIQTVGTRG